jgi:proteasome lid subunit RPN8/RPN11
VTDEPPFDEAAEPERLRGFIGEIQAAGFERIGPVSWEGPTRRSLIDDGHTDSERMTIIIRPSWPYLSPLLRVPGISAWHADQEQLCIWQAEDSSQRWATLNGIYERIDEWSQQARDGFATTENARNPEIYWQEECDRVVGLVDIDNLIRSNADDGDHDEFHFAEALSADGRPSPVAVFDLDRGPFRLSSRLPMGVPNHRVIRGRWLYRASVPHPPRSVDELQSFLTDAQRERLDRDLRTRPIVMYGLAWRNNAGLVATMILSITEENGTRSNGLVVLRPKGQDALLLRAGTDAAVLQDRSVALLGVGAIGSHVAEQLTRAGIGKLILIDYDLLWPANLIRHAAPPGTPAGAAKTAALRDHLTQYSWVEIEVVDAVVWTPSLLRGVLVSADLTVDATGHAGLAELTARIAKDANRPLVSAALFRGGAIARVRRQAMEDDTPFVQRPHLDQYPEITPLDEEVEYVGTETGCLALVHNAPPVAVAHAAALAAEVAIDHLTGRHECDDELLEVIRRGDSPFDRLGRIRRADLPVTVDLTEKAQAQLRALARAALPAETGGLLLGCIVDGRPVVSEVVEIVDDDATPTTYHVPEDATLVAIAEARASDSRLGYIGDWHSHPSGAGPSAPDIAAMAVVAEAEAGSQDPVLMIVRLSEGATERVEAYVTTEGRLRSAAICLTGELEQDLAS